MHADQFLSKVGLRRFADMNSFWKFLGSEEHEELRLSVVRLISARSKGEFSAVDGDALVAKPDTVKILHDVFAAHIRPLLHSWIDSSLPDGPVLDLGCGAGIATCFYAMCRPDVDVAGVDGSAAAIETAQQIARELNLDNISFICADIATLELQRTFQVVCSSSVWAEMERGQSRISSYFSTVNQVSTGLRGSQSELAASVARHLDARGAYVSFERCHDVASLAQWVGAQASAGLWVDLAASSMVPVEGVLTGFEVMPRLVAYVNPVIIDEDALVSWRQNGAFPSTELATELRIHRDVDWGVEQGFEVVVGDQHGEATAQLFLLKHQSKALVYFRTNRGVREILGESPRGVNELQRLFVEVLNQLLEHPHVVTSQPLTTIQ